MDTCAAIKRFFKGKLKFIFNSKVANMRHYCGSIMQLFERGKKDPLRCLIKYRWRNQVRVCNTILISNFQKVIILKNSVRFFLTSIGSGFKHWNRYKNTFFPKIIIICWLDFSDDVLAQLKPLFHFAVIGIAYNAFGSLQMINKTEDIQPQYPSKFRKVSNGSCS